ncbi:hypothetical protein [Filimonas effusa]|uniref:Uncharacterized protein n=1 Tax=Filimonas effusa TaxID=2508721 RepID=A0A4V1MAN7_9BACT|nr:hypothetical protein [Filimonas effusa]RXK86516.1 hypothetical protein ESB13_06835 [Filimonas effusa]
MFGKLIISLFYNLELYNLVIVELVGLRFSPIEMLKELITRAVLKEKLKAVILVETVSNLDRIISVTAL